MANDVFLSGKSAVVTGGGSGIGRATALRLARYGAEVVVAGRTRSSLEETVGLVEREGGRARLSVTDVSDEEQVKGLFRMVPAIDILINNAGLGVFAPLVDTTADEWDRVMAVNLRGAFLCSREAMRLMKGRGGRVINISSVVGIKGYARQAAYTASKHGLMGLSKVMAAEGQADDIITQVIAPGGVDTDMAGDARPDLDRSIMITVEDMADAVEFLLRQQGNAVTDLVQLRRRGNAAW